MCDEKPPYSIASQPYIDETSSQVAFVFAAICSTLGILGNSLTAVVLLGHPSLRRHSTTPFLASLAVSDLIFSAFNLPVLAIRFKNRDWTMSYDTCQVFPFLLFSNIIISCYSMSLIALNRFVGIYYPHRMPDVFSPKKSWLMVVATWLFAMLLMTLPLAEIWGQMGYERETFSCTIVPKDGKNPVTFLIVVGIVAPLAAMVVFYCLIFWKVRQTGRMVRDLTKASEIAVGEGSSLAGHVDPETIKERSVRYQTKRREKDLTKTLVLICSAYVLAFLPVCLLAIFDPMPPCYRHPELHVASYIIFWCTAFINPMIYIFFNRQYRNAYLHLAKRLFCCGERRPETAWYELSTTPGNNTRASVPPSRKSSAAASVKRQLKKKSSSAASRESVTDRVQKQRQKNPDGQE